MVTDRLTDEELRRVTTDDAQAHLGELQDWVAETHRPVVVERDGKTPSVLISYEEFAAFRDFQWRKRAEQAVARIRNLAQEVSSRPINRNLTEDEAEAIADEIVTDAVHAIVEKRRAARERA